MYFYKIVLDLNIYCLIKNLCKDFRKDIGAPVQKQQWRNLLLLHFTHYFVGNISEPLKTATGSPVFMLNQTVPRFCTGFLTFGFCTITAGLRSSSHIFRWTGRSGPALKTLILSIASLEMSNYTILWMWIDGCSKTAVWGSEPNQIWYKFLFKTRCIIWWNNSIWVEITKWK